MIQCLMRFAYVCINVYMLFCRFSSNLYIFFTAHLRLNFAVGRGEIEEEEDEETSSRTKSSKRKQSSLESWNRSDGRRNMYLVELVSELGFAM